MFVVSRQNGWVKFDEIWYTDQFKPGLQLRSQDTFYTEMQFPGRTTQVIPRVTACIKYLLYRLRLRLRVIFPFDSWYNINNITTSIWNFIP